MRTRRGCVWPDKTASPGITKIGIQFLTLRLGITVKQYGIHSFRESTRPGAGKSPSVDMRSTETPHHLNTSSRH
jgi:hypothetical protein